MGFDIALCNCSGVIGLLGQGVGVLLTNTLVGPLVLGTLNCTMRPNPSAWRSSVALQYSGSAMERRLRLLCLNERYDTTGPGLSNTCSLIDSGVGW